jgi:CarboxypepD_reg-like domain/TonB-dependent Receptor Plug Domain
MKRIFLAACLVLLAAWACAQGSAPPPEGRFTISGTVRDAASGEALIGASVLDRRTGRGVAANAYGFFSLTLPADSVWLVTSYTGYLPLVRKLLLTSNLQLNLNLQPLPTTLTEVVVQGESYEEKVTSAQMSVAEVRMEDAKQLPVIFGEVDIIKTLQLKPGVQSGGEGGSGLYVRGGGPDQNLILLDEATVYNASHLFGFFSIFNSDAVRNVELYKGDFPAQFGGRLSSVLNVRLKEGNREKFSGQGGLGAIASRLLLEGPLQKGKSSFLLAGRRTYFDVFTRAANQINANNPNWEPLPNYFFHDFNLKTNLALGKKDQLYLSGYLGRDVFGTRTDNFRFNFNWGNTTSTLRWSHQFGPKLFANTSVIFSDYNYLIANSFDVFSFRLRSRIRDWQAKTDFDWYATDRHHFKLGASATRHGFVIGRVDAGTDDGSLNIGLGNDYLAYQFGAYANDEFAVNDRLRLEGGVRFSGFHHQGRTFTGWEPRASATATLRPGLSAKASYAAMYQYVHLVSNSGASLPTDVWFPSTARVRPQFSQQVAGGLSTTLLGGKLLLTNEVYYKWMHNQIDFRDGAQLFANPDLENEFVFGRGWAYGNEIYLEKRQGRTTGWLGYTLSWNWRSFPDIMDGRRFHPRYDRRHDVSLVLLHQLNRRLSFTATWVYGTGNAVSLPTGRILLQDVPGTRPQVIPVYTERNGFRLAAYHRLDLGLVWKFKPRWGEADLTFSIYNAYDRRNAFFIFIDTVRDAQGNIADFEGRQSSLFPIIPAVTYNFKF